MTDVKITAGTSLADDLDAVASAWEAAARGEQVSLHLVALESLDQMRETLSPARLRVLRMVKQQPQHRVASVLALSRLLQRSYRRTRGDVTLLAEAGLLSRDGDSIVAVADKVTVEAAL